MTKLPELLVVASLLAGNISGFLVDYANVLDGPMDFSCKGNSSLTQLASHHDNRAEDRVWSFGCQPSRDEVMNCVWSGYVNDFDKPVLYECSGDEFINGFRSIHNNGPEDRRWAFQCCALRGHRRDKCHFTGYVNQYDGPLSYNVPDEQLIHGINSIHDNGSEDRIFAFEVCHFVEGGLKK
ncbi:dermatopontin-like [Mizuhopecten yessoensis]|uniref:Hemagglutinin/amebocyte aggregation factor n=1 Tax=Mizuhopecten yessoensis TaxID=6573 RepID=A0A210Q451_MIZYE|nr:dermatopontin-like [Mizuhopecten yessoensis]OWF43513.1 Hemagglutinin/amebocyte aggregation factor [Mizuhopecten yessoensis]